MVDTPPQMNLDDAATPWGRWATNTIKELLAAQGRTLSSVQNNNFATAGVAAVAGTANVAAGDAQVSAGEARVAANDAQIVADTAQVVADDAAIAAAAALEQVMLSVTSSLDEYVVTSSSTIVPAPEAAWSYDTPDWVAGQYVWRRTRNVRLNGDVFWSEPAVITGANGATGEDAVLLRVSSSRGTSFKNNTISTVLTVTVFKGAQTITNITDLQAAFGGGAYLEWWWRRINDAGFGVVSSADNRLSQAGFALTISPADVDEQSVFECRLQTTN